MNPFLELTCLILLSLDQTTILDNSYLIVTYMDSAGTVSSISIPENSIDLVYASSFDNERYDLIHNRINLSKARKTSESKYFAI